MANTRELADAPPESSRAGDARAAVVVAYAALRTFFPDLAVTGDVLDARLDETLALLGEGTPDRATVFDAVRRFTEAVHDSHVTVRDVYRERPTSFAPLALYPSGEELVALRSASPEVRPGDIVLEIDGVGVAALVAQASRLISGSPQTVLRRAATAIVPRAAFRAKVKSPGGEPRMVDVAPAAAALAPTTTVFERPRGTLDDLGAPDVYYVSLNKGTITDADVSTIAAEMIGMRAVILDMRGYPDRPSWSVLGSVAPGEARGPRLTHLLVGAGWASRRPDREQRLSGWSTLDQSFTGSVVLLVGNETQSQAEHLTTFFRSSGRGLVIGQKTSGANGTITGVQLPGGYGFSFSGMIAENPDGSAFHARGIVPDIEVAPAPVDVSEGRDTVLLRALEALRTP